MQNGENVITKKFGQTSNNILKLGLPDKVWNVCETVSQTPSKKGVLIVY